VAGIMEAEERINILWLTTARQTCWRWSRYWKLPTEICKCSFGQRCAPVSSDNDRGHPHGRLHADLTVWETAELIRAVNDPANIPIIFLTAEAAAQAFDRDTLWRC